MHAIEDNADSARKASRMLPSGPTPRWHQSTHIVITVQCCKLETLPNMFAIDASNVVSTGYKLKSSGVENVVG